MLQRLILATVVSLVSMFTGPASAWVEGVVDRTEAAVDNARCVYRGSPNDTVYLVHPPTNPQIMPDSEVRTAMLDLTDALSTSGRFQVVRGRALRIDATTRANTPEGRQEIEKTLDQVTKAAVTIYVEPYQRIGDSVRVEVTLLVRSTENFRNVLTCTPSFRIDIPVVNGAQPPTPPALAPVDAEAQYQLGLRHLRGDGVEQNFRLAVQYFQSAAELGHVNAQDSMGWRYYRGDYVTKDNVLAYMWWKVTVLRGHPDGPKQLGLVRDKLAPDQINYADSLASRCIQQNYRDCGH